MKILIDAGTILGALTAFSLAGGLLWIAACEIGHAREARRERKAAAALIACEACELTDKEQLVFERYAVRYSGLGDEVTR